MIEDKLIAELIGAKLAEHVERKQDESFEVLQDIEMANRDLIEAYENFTRRDKLGESTAVSIRVILISKDARTEAMKKYLQLINE